MQITNNNRANKSVVATQNEQTAALPMENINPDLQPEINLDYDLATDFDNKKTDTEKSFIQIVNQKIMPTSAFGSAIINLVSAPLRLFEDSNPIKKIINSISMLSTKINLALVGAMGMYTAHEQKNPLLLFSYAVEALSTIFDLRKIYLFRGIATGIDGAVGAFKERHETQNPGKDFIHKNYTEGFQTCKKHFVDIIKEFYDSIKKNPLSIFKPKGQHTLVGSSLMMVFGSIFGMTINEKLGAFVRDLFGGLNDVGLVQLDNSKTARNAGIFYLMGTFKDFIARFFNEANAEKYGIKEVEKFKRGRDVMHELTFAFDKLGQFFFLRYNQEKNKTEAMPNINRTSEYVFDPRTMHNQLVAQQAA